MLRSIVKNIAARSGVQFDFVRGFAWNHAAKISEYFLLYVFSVIAARVLGPHANGMYVTLISISQLLLALSSVALDIAMNRFLPHIAEPEKKAKIVYLVRRLLLVKIVLFSFFSILLVVGWNSFQQRLDIQSPVAGYIIFIVALGFVRAISSTLYSVWISQFESKIVFIVNTGTLVLQILAALIVAGNGHELNAFLLVVLFG